MNNALYYVLLVIPSREIVRMSWSRHFVKINGYDVVNDQPQAEIRAVFIQIIEYSKTLTHLSCHPMKLIAATVKV